MKISRRGSWVRLVAVALFAAGPAAAQESVVLELVDRGKPLADVPVRVRDGDVGDVPELVDRGKAVGITAADGTVTVEGEDVAFADGTPVELWVVDCADGRVEVVLVREGTDDPCAGEADQAGERCGCRRVGAFAWGADHVAPRPRVGGGDRRAAAGSSHLFGLGAGISYFPNLEDAVLDQGGLIDAEVSTTGLTVYGVYEFKPSRDLPFAVGVGGSLTELDEIRQLFDPTPEGPSASTIDLRRWTVGGYMALRQPVIEGPEYSRLAVGIAAHALWMFNDIFVRTTLSDAGQPAVADRSESGFRTGVTGGLDLFFSRRFGLRLEAGFLFGEGDDADTSVEARVFPLLIRIP